MKTLALAVTVGVIVALYFQVPATAPTPVQNVAVCEPLFCL